MDTKIFYFIFIYHMGSIKNALFSENKKTSKHKGNVCISMGASSKSSTVVLELIFVCLKMLHSKASMSTSSSLLTFLRLGSRRSANWYRWGERDNDFIERRRGADGVARATRFLDSLRLLLLVRRGLRLLRGLRLRTWSLSISISSMIIWSLS